MSPHFCLCCSISFLYVQSWFYTGLEATCPRCWSWQIASNANIFWAAFGYSYSLDEQMPYVLIFIALGKSKFAWQYVYVQYMIIQGPILAGPQQAKKNTTCSKNLPPMDPQACCAIMYLVLPKNAHWCIGDVSQQKNGLEKTPVDHIFLCPYFGT